MGIAHENLGKVGNNDAERLVSSSLTNRGLPAFQANMIGRHEGYHNRLDYFSGKVGVLWQTIEGIPVGVAGAFYHSSGNHDRYPVIGLASALAPRLLGNMGLSDQDKRVANRYQSMGARFEEAEEWSRAVVAGLNPNPDQLDGWLDFRSRFEKYVSFTYWICKFGPRDLMGIRI